MTEESLVVVSKILVHQVFSAIVGIEIEFKTDIQIKKRVDNLMQFLNFS